jgi:hypothetical protein
MDVHITTLDLGNFLGATEIPLAYVPTYGGGITVLSAHLSGTAAGTAIGAKLIVMTDVGTPALASTIGAFAGTCVTAAGVVFAMTIGTAYVGGAKWIGYDQTSGTVPAGTFISLAYTMGK